jgi:putative nucleotidyltransferase with HDIG domain
LLNYPFLNNKVIKLIIIGQLSVYFGLIILSLRHFYVYPANHYPLLVCIMVVGFLPSLLYLLLPDRFTSYILVSNALIIVSLIFVLLKEWALAGVFILVPVFSLLFQEKKVYLFSSISSFVFNIILALVFLYDSSNSDINQVILLDVLTVFIILVFIIYFVVKDLRWRYMEEARVIQTILTLSQSVEVKDPFTQGHSERVAYLGKLIASKIPTLNPEIVYDCGLIHDVGKLSIPDRILLKDKGLTTEEYQVMKSHTTNGAKLCKNLKTPPELVLGVKHHHERWDGEGYPSALKGDQIPLIGRIICVADSIDAMCSNRAYRDALKMEDVLYELKKCSGSQFDPSIIKTTLNCWDEIKNYYTKILE